MGLNTHASAASIYAMQPPCAAPTILTYHRVTDDTSDWNFYDMPCATFERQVALLAARSMFRPSVALNFDDGTSDHLGVAECLHRHNLRGTFFIVTDWIGRPGFLSRSQLRSLLGLGHVLGSHTVTHARLTTLPTSVLREELERSKKLLEDLTGRPVDAFAAPGGYLNDRATDMAFDCGYLTVRSMDWGYNDPARIGRRPLRTIPVFPSTTDERFEKIVLGRARFTTFHLKQAAKKILSEDLYIRLRNGAAKWGRTA